MLASKSRLACISCEGRRTGIEVSVVQADGDGTVFRQGELVTDASTHLIREHGRIIVNKPCACGSRAHIHRNFRQPNAATDVRFPRETQINIIKSIGLEGQCLKIAGEGVGASLDSSLFQLIFQRWVCSSGRKVGISSLRLTLALAQASYALRTKAPGLLTFISSRLCFR